MSTFTFVIEVLANKAKMANTPQEAMHYTQAALNLAHVVVLLVNSKAL